MVPYLVVTELCMTIDRFIQISRILANLWIVASKLGAELLVLLTDVDAVYTDNPPKNKKAQKVSKISSLKEIDQIQTQGKSDTGRGGMISKLMAA